MLLGGLLLDWTWQVAGLGAVLLAATVLLVVWWRQQSFRWALVLAVCLLLAPAFSFWSSLTFEVAPYRAGCDGICPGQRGAPIATHICDTAGCTFRTGPFVLNSLVYLVLFLAWGSIVHALLRSVTSDSHRAAAGRFVLGIGLLIAPVAFAPVFLPAPQAHVRGDSQRVAINAQREAYMYDEGARLPVVRLALEDVRPRLDDQPGLRVCLRTYSYFYLPTGFMYLDMTPEGVHSNNGGTLPRTTSCWR
jgi:hypothetical protein